MTEQAVKDAKAKRDAAQAELDKAVNDTKDEIAKANDAVKEAAPEKPEPEPIHVPSLVIQPSHGVAATSSFNLPKVAVGVVILLVALSLSHWVFKLF